jgi:hypothetical protein
MWLVAVESSNSIELIETSASKEQQFDFASAVANALAMLLSEHRIEFEITRKCTRCNDAPCSCDFMMLVQVQRALQSRAFLDSVRRKSRNQTSRILTITADVPGIWILIPPNNFNWKRKINNNDTVAVRFLCEYPTCTSMELANTARSPSEFLSTHGAYLVRCYEHMLASKDHRGLSQILENWVAYLKQFGYDSNRSLVCLFLTIIQEELHVPERSEFFSTFLRKDTQLFRQHSRARCSWVCRAHKTSTFTPALSLPHWRAGDCPRLLVRYLLGSVFPREHLAMIEQDSCYCASCLQENPNLQAHRISGWVRFELPCSILFDVSSDEEATSFSATTFDVAKKCLLNGSEQFKFTGASLDEDYGILVSSPSMKYCEAAGLNKDTVLLQDEWKQGRRFRLRCVFELRQRKRDISVRAESLGATAQKHTIDPQIPNEAIEFVAVKPDTAIVVALLVGVRAEY